MKIEPPADMRELATTHRQMFVAYVDAGFSDVQAVRLVCAWIRSSVNR